MQSQAGVGLGASACLSGTWWLAWFVGCFGRLQAAVQQGTLEKRAAACGCWPNQYPPIAAHQPLPPSLYLAGRLSAAPPAHCRCRSRTARLRCSRAPSCSRAPRACSSSSTTFASLDWGLLGESDCCLDVALLPPGWGAASAVQDACMCLNAPPASVSAQLPACCWLPTDAPSFPPPPHHHSNTTHGSV